MEDMINEKAKALYNAALETMGTEPGSIERRNAIDKENIAEDEWIKAKNRIRRKYNPVTARKIIEDAAREFRGRPKTERELRIELDEMAEGQEK